MGVTGTKGSDGDNACSVVAVATERGGALRVAVGKSGAGKEGESGTTRPPEAAPEKELTRTPKELKRRSTPTPEVAAPRGSWGGAWGQDTEGSREQPHMASENPASPPSGGKESAVLPVPYPKSSTSLANDGIRPGVAAESGSSLERRTDGCKVGLRESDTSERDAPHSNTSARSREEKYANSLAKESAGREEGSWRGSSGVPAPIVELRETETSGRDPPNSGTSEWSLDEKDAKPPAKEGAGRELGEAGIWPGSGAASGVEEGVSSCKRAEGTGQRLGWGLMTSIRWEEGARTEWRSPFESGGTVCKRTPLCHTEVFVLEK